MNEGTKRNAPSEKTRLKHEAKYLRGQIRQVERLLQQRQAVSDLRAKLEDMQDRAKNPERYAYENR